jgi:hypothetical protein
VYEEEPEEVKEIPEVPKSNIYDVLKILDRFKKEDALRRVYKTNFDYDRHNNQVSLIFKIDNFRKSGDFDNLFNSEYVQDMLNSVRELELSKSFTKNISNRNNYKLHLHGNIAIYQTPYFRIQNL